MGLDSVEILMEAERLFNIEIPDEVAMNISTFGDLVDCVLGASRTLGRELERSEVQQTLRVKVAELIGVPIEQVTLASRFIEDLQID